MNDLAIFYILSGLASFAAVFLKIFQLQNINGNHIRSAMATSYAIALLDVAVILAIVKGDWLVFLFTGTGGAFGVLLSMKAHRRLFKKVKR